MAEDLELDQAPDRCEAEPSADALGVSGVHVVGLQRSFGSVKAIDDVSFTAPRGAVTALVGPSGAGKTTLLLILAGLLAPDKGKATISGAVSSSTAEPLVCGTQAARSLIGWMPDVFGTWEALTAREILATFGAAQGLDKSTIAQRTELLLKQVHLTDYATSPARVLSRGQKQRLGLARALIHDPAVILLDEPASGLDPRSRVELRDILRGLAEQGKTILISSHILSELEEFIDQAIFLSKGRTVEVAEPEEENGGRGWRLGAIDPSALRAFLTASDIPWRDSPGRAGEVTVQLRGPESASQLLLAAVAADVPLHTIAPLSGRLEETYLQLNEER
ncbi:MAG: ABC transporter ATP-binding protein [Propionibacteriaceae bacterium]|jgi:ABC-type multidrug transport system ATPase subunit|nr:ABC transporter ATP-binding protein [Propionibacteriaceae bacterium]